VVEAVAYSDLRRDQISEEESAGMRRFDRAAQVRDKATITSLLVRGLLKKALEVDNPASARLHIMVADELLCRFVEEMEAEDGVDTAN
jgi:hypothetical protein